MAEQAAAAETAARDELDQVPAEAAEQVADARAEAEQHRADVEAERDRVLTEREARPRQEIEQARGDADQPRVVYFDKQLWSLPPSGITQLRPS